MQPITAADHHDLVQLADRDFRVPANNAELFHRLLHKHGVGTRVVRYPGRATSSREAASPATWSTA